MKNLPDFTGPGEEDRETEGVDLEISIFPEKHEIVERFKMKKNAAKLLIETKDSAKTRVASSYTASTGEYWCLTNIQLNHAKLTREL